MTILLQQQQEHLMNSEIKDPQGLTSVLDYFQVNFIGIFQLDLKSLQ